MSYCNPMEPLLEDEGSGIAQTSFMKDYQACPERPSGYGNLQEKGTGYLNPQDTGTGYMNPHERTSQHLDSREKVLCRDDPLSIEDSFYDTDDSEAELTAAYNELDGNCQDPFPSPRLLENQRRRLANRFKGAPGNEKLSVMLVQLPDETCMLRCMTGTIIGTLAVIVLIIVLYCMKIRENTGLPLEVDEFQSPDTAADIVGLGAGL